ncbi:UNVERIFIED_ORG: hypothetical protein FNL38_101677 [Nocardia globerula]|uniref:Uncharacterized protein n=1 Tax=Nocardia globerula TaxID=1818 RepID=A0A652YXB4_NOCGL|nr:hypothetical protein [Rhodococcus globerulus]NMD59314.1 hypothetical protein [Nocardia globerula]PVX64615.1 hypothetical protein C8E04_1896 [Rhodococcus globerulus]
MSDYDDIGTSTEEHEETPKSKRPSALLLIAGIAAFLVSGWALLGPFSLAPAADIQFRWLFVGAAVIAGLLLVILPNRK